MAFRLVLIENGAKIRYKLDNLIIHIDDREVSIPVNDISTIVIDNHDTTLSTRVLNTLAKENVCLVICGVDHLPIGIYMGFCNHSRASKIIGRQIALSEREKDLCWMKLIEAKLVNQAKVLKRFGYDEAAMKVLHFAEDIEPGDPTNREAHGAKVYFNALMGKSFSRGDDGILMNSGLNYGYTILRSYIARLCVGYGLNTMLGLHHCSEYNQFNLVDDLIEPVRPLLDVYVHDLLKDEKYFTFVHRQKLINFINHKVRYEGKTQYLANALESYVSHLCEGIKQGDLSTLAIVDVDNYVGEA